MGKAEKKDVSLWQDRITTSKKWRDSVAETSKWETYIDEYKGKYGVVLGNVNVPPIGEVFAYVQALIANLFYKNPFIAVNAKKTGTLAGAFILEAAVNHYWAELNIKSEVEREIMDCILVGHGWNKVGNNVKTAGDGSSLHITSEKLFSNRVSWKDMLMNIGSKNPPNDCAWLAQRIYRPVEDLKRDYGAAARDIQGSAHPIIEDKIRKEMLYKDDINFAALWEIHDARERKIYLMAEENTSKWLMDPRPWSDWRDEFPYQMLYFNEVNDEPYPMSDIAPWNAQILEKIKIFTMMLNHVKRWNRQLLMKKNTMTASELDKFEKGIDGTILQAAVSGNASIQDAIKALDFGALPPDIYMVLDRIDALIRKINGMPEMMFGGTPKTSTRTEGELDMIQGGADKRIDRKLDRIERHCEAIARELIANMKANFDLDQVVKITGKEPPEILQAFEGQGIFNRRSGTFTFTKEAIKGEYDVSVKAGSTLPLDKMTRDQILNKVLQVSIPLASAPTLPPFIGEIIKDLLKDYDIKGLQVAFDQQQAAIAAQDQARAASQDQADNKVAAETEKRAAQANQIQVDTVLKAAQALARASELAPGLEITK